MVNTIETHPARTVQIAAIVLTSLVYIFTVIWLAGTMSEKIVALQRSDVSQWDEINRNKRNITADAVTLGKIQANTENLSRQSERLLNFLMKEQRETIK